MAMIGIVLLIVSSFVLFSLSTSIASLCFFLSTVTIAVITQTAATTAKVDTLYAFANPEDVCTVTAYIWMEGCDEDCTAANITTLTGEANKINAVFGFCAGATN